MNIGYEVLKHLKMNRCKQIELCKLTGILISEMSEIIHNKRKLTIKNAKLIEKHLEGFDADMLLHAQLDNDINNHRMKQKHFV